METLDVKEFVSYLNDLQHLKTVAAFNRIMQGNARAIEFLHDSLCGLEPSDTVALARVQGEILHRKKFQREYDDCEKLIFKLANDKKPAINKNNEGGIVPPRR